MLRNIINPLITFLILLGLWILSISWFNVPDYIFPAPLAVLKALKIGFWEGLFWPHLFSSLRATLYGYLIGCGSAFVTGVLVAGSKAFEKFVYPYVVGFQSMPKVAIAPLIIMWFGFGITSKIIIVALICFFPVFVNTVAGIRATDPNLIDLLRVFSASRAHIFFHAELPSAASHIFAGLQISIVFGLIGTIVAEFVSSQRGLGVLIEASSHNLDVAANLAVLLILGILGVAGSELVEFVHKKVVFWEVEGTQTATTV
jgi:NitT/TauT family transport system permease protein